MQASDAATISAAHELLELCGGSARTSTSEAQHDAKRAKLSSRSAGFVWPGQGQVAIGEPELTHKVSTKTGRTTAALERWAAR